ncbi:MAG TPA: hypothetical protein VFK41_03085 [Nocardioidaceae bacterium]|nr:hypothetical protein [Nocardioidaceae bacterium]
MTHVVLKKHPNGTVEFVVDGVDLSAHAFTQGFRIELGDETGHPAKVHCIIAADSLDAELTGIPPAVADAPRTDAIVGEGEFAERGYAVEVEV